MLDAAELKSYQQRFDTIRSLEKEQLIPDDQKTRLTIKDAGKNALFQYEGKTWSIQDINRYEETSEDFKQRKGYFIYELTCLCLETGKSVFFEWEEDDTLEISMTLEQAGFRNLTDDEGQAIDEDDLDQIADDRDAVILNGEKFWYEDDWPAVYEKGGKTENVYMYEFENESHSRFLTIEEWSGSGRDTYRIYTSMPVPPNAVDLITRGDV